MSWRKGQPPSAIAGAEGGAICDEDADVKPAVCASASRASSCEHKTRARERGWRQRREDEDFYSRGIVAGTAEAHSVRVPAGLGKWSGGVYLPTLNRIVGCPHSSTPKTARQTPQSQ